MTVKKYFGTDGIRNQVGRGLMCPDQILKLGWATGRVLKKHGASTVMIGKDTRISGYMFESALESGFIYAGINVLLLGPMPTPAVAYLTQTFSADLGIVISASHNPHYDNGIKFFDAQGHKISDEFEAEIEASLEQVMRFEGDVADLAHLGRAQRIDDAPGRYIEFCKSTYRSVHKLDGLHLVVDCAHGATYHIAPHVFRELGAKVTTIGASPDGLNINKGCGATDLQALQTKVLEEKADLGIALDGDGDRLMLVDGQGEVIDGDQILYLLACYAYADQPGVVGTLMTNLGVEKALQDAGFELVRAKVGDRYVMQELKQRGWLLGAEGSGHVLCLNKSTTGDGVVAALQILSIVQKSQKSLRTLLEPLVKYPQVLINVKVTRPFDSMASEALQAAVAEFEREYEQQARVLIRASGTEPLVRVMVEGENLQKVEDYAKKLAKIVEIDFS
jgi:phosphoglucosamine mutase